MILYDLWYYTPIIFIIFAVTLLFRIRNEQRFRQLISYLQFYGDRVSTFHETMILHCSFEMNVARIFKNGTMPGKRRREGTTYDRRGVLDNGVSCPQYIQSPYF